MSQNVKKISELDQIPSLSDDDYLVVVDKSDTSTSTQGTTKQTTFGQIRTGVVSELSSPDWGESDTGSLSFIRNKPFIPPAYILPKATATTLGGVVAGAGLSIDSSGTLRSVFSGSYNDLTNKPTIPSSLTGLGDTLITAAQENNILVYKSGRWTNSTISYSNISGLPTNLVTQNSTSTLSNLLVTGDLVVSGTTTSNNFETLNVGSSQVVLNDQVGRYTGDAFAGQKNITNITDTSGILLGQSLEISDNGGTLTLPPGVTVTNVTPTSLELSGSFGGTGSQSGIVFSVGITPTANASVTVNRAGLADSRIRWNEISDRWEFTNNGTEYYSIPLPAEYADYNNLANTPPVPSSITDLSDVSGTSPAFTGEFLRWNGAQYVPSFIQNSDLSAITINAMGDVDTTTVPPSIGEILKWDGGKWVPSADLIGGLETGGSIVTPSLSSSIIPFYYTTTTSFPNPTTYRGALAYSESGGDLYYGHFSEWIKLAKYSDLEAVEYYTISATDVTGQSTKKSIRLSGTTGSLSSVTLTQSGSLSITRNGNELTLNSPVYSLSTTAGSGNSVKLALNDSNSGQTEVSLVGADGLLVERTDPTTITLRAPANTVTQYTDNMAKDAVSVSLLNGTHSGITFIYDSINRVINSVVTGGGEGETAVLYDLVGTSTTSNNAFIQLIPSSGVTDQVEITGSGGTSVSWDGLNNRISLSSVSPVNPDWDEDDPGSLSFILNKPSIPSPYTLPVATESTLGGVKVGDNLTIDPDGTLNAVPGAYVLPIATTTALGGIKIGSGLSISEDGTVTVAAGEGGTPLQSRTTVSGTTESVVTDTADEITVVGFRAYNLLKIAATADAWVRIYVDEPSMVADRTRSEGNDPGPGSGVIAEARGSGTTVLSPCPFGFNNDSPVTSNVYVSVTNRSGVAQPITVTLTLIRAEA